MYDSSGRASTAARADWIYGYHHAISQTNVRTYDARPQRGLSRCCGHRREVVPLNFQFRPSGSSSARQGRAIPSGSGFEGALSLSLSLSLFLTERTLGSRFPCRSRVARSPETTLSSRRETASRLRPVEPRDLARSRSRAFIDQKLTIFTVSSSLAAAGELHRPRRAA